MALSAHLIIFDTFEYIVVSKTFIFYKILHGSKKTHFLDQIYNARGRCDVKLPPNTQLRLHDIISVISGNLVTSIGNIHNVVKILQSLRIPFPTVKNFY